MKKFSNPQKIISSANIAMPETFMDKLKKNAIYYCLFLIVTFCLIISLIIFIEYGFYKVCSCCLPKLLAIVFQIFCHFLVIRYIVLKVAFAGTSFLIIRPNQYLNSKFQAYYLESLIKALIASLNIFTNEFMKIHNLYDFINLKKNYCTVRELVNYLVEVFTKMKNKFGNLSTEQNNLYGNLLALSDTISNSDLDSFVSGIIKLMKDKHIESLNDLENNNKEPGESASDNKPEGNIKEQGEELMKIRKQIKSYETNIQRIKMACSNIIDIFDDFTNAKYNLFSFRAIRNYFKNYLFGSKEQNTIEFENIYDYEERKLRTKDGEYVEYGIITGYKSPRKDGSNKAKNNKENINEDKDKYDYEKKNLMIICGPNGASFQQFIKYINIDLYLDQNIDVLCWNYRGYGFSTGSPNFNNLREDILEIYDEVTKERHYKNIGTHGISIGGIPCCHLAANRNISLLICDRNFGQMDNIAKALSFGKYLYLLYKILMFQNSNNFDNFLSPLNKKCIKIIMNDPNDAIVKEVGSLKTMVSSALVNKYLRKADLMSNANTLNTSSNINLSYNEDKTLTSTNINTSNVKDNNISLNSTFNNTEQNSLEVESLTSKKKSNIISTYALNEQNEFNQNSPLTNSNINNNINNNNENIFSIKGIKSIFSKIKNISAINEDPSKVSFLDVIFQNIQKKNNFLNCIINITDALNDNDLEISNVKSNKGFINKCKNLFQNKQNNKYQNLGNSDISENINKNSNLNNYNDLIKCHILEFLELFQSAGDNLLTILNYDTLYMKLNFLENFFNNLIIYGIKQKYSDPCKPFSKINLYSSEGIDIKLKDLLNYLNEFLGKKEIQTINEKQIIQDINLFKNLLESFYKNLSQIFINSPDENVFFNETEKFEKKLLELGKGNLVSLDCGHNGNLSDSEYNTFIFYLKKSIMFKDFDKNNKKRKKEDENNINNNNNNNNNINNDINNNDINNINNNNNEEDSVEMDFINNDS